MIVVIFFLKVENLNDFEDVYYFEVVGLYFDMCFILVSSFSFLLCVLDGCWI